MLPLLLRLEVEARQAAQVLAAHRLVHGGAAPDALHGESWGEEGHGEG